MIVKSYILPSRMTVLISNIGFKCCSSLLLMAGLMIVCVFSSCCRSPIRLADCRIFTTPVASGFSSCCQSLLLRHAAKTTCLLLLKGRRFKMLPVASSLRRLPASFLVVASRIFLLPHGFSATVTRPCLLSLPVDAPSCCRSHLHSAGRQRLLFLLPYVSSSLLVPRCL